MKVALNGRGGKVGSVLGPALEETGHELVPLGDAEAMVDFTAPEVALANVRAALAGGVACIVGTTGWDMSEIDAEARAAGLPVFYAPNFALGAVLMMRFAREAAELMPRAEIIEAHNEAKKDAPSGTAKATAALIGGEGQLLTIRHDAFTREAYVPGVLLVLPRLPSLPPGLSVGLETLLS